MAETWSSKDSLRAMTTKFNSAVSELEDLKQSSNQVNQATVQKFTELEESLTEQFQKVNEELDQKISDVTAEDLGLGEVDNTSDVNKPVSTLQAEAIQSAKDELQLNIDEKVSSEEESLITSDEVPEVSPIVEKLIRDIIQEIGGETGVTSYGIASKLLLGVVRASSDVEVDSETGIMSVPKLKNLDSWLESLNSNNQVTQKMLDAWGDMDKLSTTDKTTLVAALNEVFQSVSKGKTKVASALTDRGVITQPDATFDTISQNIANISGGAYSRCTLYRTNTSFSLDWGQTVVLKNIMCGAGYKTSVALSFNTANTISIQYETHYSDGTLVTSTATVKSVVTVSYWVISDLIKVVNNAFSIVCRPYTVDTLGGAPTLVAAYYETSSKSVVTTQIGITSYFDGTYENSYYFMPCIDKSHTLIGIIVTRTSKSTGNTQILFFSWKMNQSAQGWNLVSNEKVILSSTASTYYHNPLGFYHHYVYSTGTHSIYSLSEVNGTLVLVESFTEETSDTLPYLAIYIGRLSNGLVVTYDSNHIYLIEFDYNGNKFSGYQAFEETMSSDVGLIGDIIFDNITNTAYTLEKDAEGVFSLQKSVNYFDKVIFRTDNINFDMTDYLYFDGLSGYAIK